MSAQSDLKSQKQRRAKSRQPVDELVGRDPSPETLERIRWIQEQMVALVPANVALVDELIADRRAAAARGD